MIRKGIVSSINAVNKTARITFRDMDKLVTSEIPYSSNITLQVGALVGVAFFSENKKDGVIFVVF